MEINAIADTLFVFFIASSRIIAVFTVVPFLSRQSLGTNMIRNGVAASLTLLTYPIAAHGLEQQAFGAGEILAILGKEVLIGLGIGYLFALPFWSIEAVGFFIDNQRGATMASSLNPLSGSQTSPIGILLTQALVTLFFISGAFLLMLQALYMSYSVWPIFSFFPTFSGNGPEFFLGQLDNLMYLAMLLGGPVVIAMFLSEFGLALISRFAPQLNVFILSLPIKSAVGIAFLCVFVGFVLRYFGELLEKLGDSMIGLFQVIT